MKVLFHHHTPFALENGGFRRQIIGTKDALESLGIEVEYLRWYDGSQRGDILHFFGRMPMEMFRQAQEKRMKIVITDSFTDKGPRSRVQLRLQRMAIQFIERATPGLSAGIYNWPVYRGADACISPTARDAELLNELFRVPKEKVHIIGPRIEFDPEHERMGWLDVAKELKALYESLPSTSR